MINENDVHLVLRPDGLFTLGVACGGGVHSWIVTRDVAERIAHKLLAVLEEREA